MKRFAPIVPFFCALFAALALTACSGSDAPSTPLPDGEGLTVHFIDVGQADAALVTCGGEAMLIDGGNVGDSDLLYTYLEAQNISALKYVVGTHAHEDHMGGLPGALHYAAVDTAFCSTTTSDTKFFRDFVSALEAQGKAITVPELGSRYPLGDAEFQFVGPVYEDDDPNNMSLVLRLTYGSTSFLFTGDAAREEEADILETGYDVSATVLKAGHHGSAGSTTYPFLRAVAPSYAVISCETDNSYGHPHHETLSRFRDADVTVYRTDLQGTVLCHSDGKNLSFTTEKNAGIDTNPAQTEAEGYIGNINSHVFHRTSCSGLPDEKNRIYFSGRSEAVAAGYSPCGRCEP